MPTGILETRLVADVKCYFCGHVSGQIIGRRNGPLRVTNFVPRPGYTGAEIKPGVRLRCERCQGPVFLEDTTTLPGTAGSRKTAAMRRNAPDKRGGRAA